eukprot:4273317-Pleurochrysis_carterae.AAC.1
MSFFTATGAGGELCFLLDERRCVSASSLMAPMLGVRLCSRLGARPCESEGVRPWSRLGVRLGVSAASRRLLDPDLPVVPNEYKESRVLPDSLELSVQVERQTAWRAPWRRASASRPSRARAASAARATWQRERCRCPAGRGVTSATTWTPLSARLPWASPAAAASRASRRACSQTAWACSRLRRHEGKAAEQLC